MTITLTDKLLEYVKKKNVTSITVTIKKKRSNCCALGVPMAYLGPPKKTPECFEQHIVNALTIYVKKNMPLSSGAITLDFSELLTLKMIDVHGIEIERLI